MSKDDEKEPETIETEEAPKEEVLPATLPLRLFMALTGRSNYEHSGRSDYAAKIGGYRFALGSVIVINHPIDIAYFIGKRKQLTFIAMHASNAKGTPKMPAELKGKHLITRFANFSDPKKSKKYAKMRTEAKTTYERLL